VDKWKAGGRRKKAEGRRQKVKVEGDEWKVEDNIARQDLNLDGMKMKRGGKRIQKRKKKKKDKPNSMISNGRQATVHFHLDDTHKVAVDGGLSWGEKEERAEMMIERNFILVGLAFLSLVLTVNLGMLR